MAFQNSTQNDTDHWYIPTNKSHPIIVWKFSRTVIVKSFKYWQYHYTCKINKVVQVRQVGEQIQNTMFYILRIFSINGFPPLLKTCWYCLNYRELTINTISMKNSLNTLCLWLLWASGIWLKGILQMKFTCRRLQLKLYWEKKYTFLWILKSLMEKVNDGDDLRKMNTPSTFTGYEYNHIQK